MSKKKKSNSTSGVNRFTEAAGFLVASIILDSPDGLTTITASSSVRTAEKSVPTGSTRLVTIKQGESLRYWTHKDGNCVDQKTFIRQLANYMSKKDDGKFSYQITAARTETGPNLVIDNDLLREHLVQPATVVEGWILKGGIAIPDDRGIDTWGPLQVQPGRDLYASLESRTPIQSGDAAEVTAGIGVMEQGVAFITGVVEGAPIGTHVITVAGAPNGVGRVFFDKDGDGVINIAAEKDGEHVSAHTIIGLELAGKVEATLRSSVGNHSAFGPVEEVRGWTVAVDSIKSLTSDQVIERHSIDPVTGKLVATDHGIAYRDAWDIAGAEAA